MEIQSFRTDDCINEVIEKYSLMIYRLAFAQMKNKHDAEDVFQEVFLRYISKPRKFESEEHRKAWLLRVTINRCRTVLGSWFRKTESLDNTLVADTYVEDDLSDYLLLLPKKYRSVIHLFYYEKLSIKQISKIMTIKESTIRTQLSRARSILRERLKEDCLYE